MRRLALLAALCLSVPSCIELCGQRVSLHYDVAKDELQLLIFYDGVFETESAEKGDSALETFLGTGSLLFLDWPFHVEMDAIRKVANEGDAPPALRALAVAVTTQVSVKTLGSQKDSRGRVGGVQLVTITKATPFLAKVNAAIDEALRASWTPDAGWRRTADRVRGAAATKGGYRWISLDGQALRLQSPIHPGEWAAAKAKVLDDALTELLTQETDDARREKKRGDLRNAVRGLTAVPLTLIDGGDEVALRIGDPKRPSTLRFTLRDEYQPTLEAALARRVPADVSAALATHLLANKPSADDPLGDIAAWGPPEEAVRALVTAAADPKRQEAALRALDERSKAWNAGLGVPEAPVATGPAAAMVAAWTEWLGKMERWPLY